MSVINEINAVTSSLNGIERQRLNDKYLATLRQLSHFDLANLDNELAIAGRQIKRIRKDICNIRLERYLNEQISNKEG